VDGCKRLNAPANCTFETIGRVGIRKVYDGLNGCKDVLGSVLSFPCEFGDTLVGALSIRNVPGDF